MLELVGAINTELAKFAPEYVTEPKSAIFRIYRDTRFSADKTPYKTHIAASFSRRDGERLGSGRILFQRLPRCDRSGRGHLASGARRDAALCATISRKRTRN